MPTYEFRCRACQHQFEVFQSMSAADPDACEECGAAELEKVLFPVAVHYKGSGFYNTDYGTSKAPAGGDAGSTSTSGDGGSSSSSTDSTGTSTGGSSDAGTSTASSSSTD